MLLTMGISGFAQSLADYTFTTGTDATKWITLSTTSSLITPGAGDYGVSTVHDIGFPFIFGEETYSQFSVNADGNLRFGSTVTGTSNYTSPFNSSNAGINAPKINMLGCDGFLSDSGHVYHEVIGSEPDRVCVIEFATSTYNTSSRPSLLRWQVQLFEGTNDIQIVYASTTPPILPAVTRQAGMSVDGSDVLLLDASHQVTHYTAGQSTTIASGTWPDVDRYYLFTAPVITCPNVTAITVSNLTSTSLDLSWTPVGSESNWDLYITSTDSDIPDATSTPTDYASGVPEYSLSGLTAYTTYHIYVRANCGSGDVSGWKACTVRTPCEPLTTLPFMENFDSHADATTTSAATSNLPYCWSHINNGTSTTYSGYPIIYTSATLAASGSNSLRFYTYTTSGTYDDQMAILPQIDPSIYPINNLQISFDARNNSTYTFTVVVGIITNPVDKNTFVPMDTIVTTSNTYTNYEFPLDQYTGTGGYIAIMAPRPSSSYNSGYIDNIVVDLIPACPKPTGLTTTAITESSIDLTWTEHGSANSWEIVYGEAGFDANTATPILVTSHPYEVQNLDAASAYQFRVRAVCGNNESSYWSSSATATTLCDGLISLPYTMDFEGYAGTVYNDANGIAPACWTTYSTNTSYGAPHITSSGSYHYTHSGNNCMVFTCSSAGANAYAALPIFDQPLNSLVLNFWYAMESATQGTLTVGYVTDLTDISTSFQTVATIPSVANSSGGDTITVDFTAANIPTTGNICFHWYKDGTYYSCCIDDINVIVAGSGPVVTAPSVATNNATAVEQTTATLNATITNPDNVTITAKGFEWKTTADGTYTQISGTGSGNNFTANLTNLTPSTGYTFRAFITYNGVNLYGSAMTFTTLPEGAGPCNMPTGLRVADNGIQAESITVTWNDDTNVSSWRIQYRPTNGTLASATATTNSYTIAGLTPNTEYQIQVQADCGDNNLSDWTEVITATTSNVGVDEYLSNSITLYPNPTNDVVNVQCTMTNVQVGAVEVINVYGKVVRTVNVIDTPTRINVSSLADGMYFVRVTTDNGVVTKPFVKK